MGLALGAGADAVKLQCYTPDNITLDCDKPDFIIKDGPWKDRKLHELYQKAHTPLEWFPDLFALAKRYGYPLFASVFDKSSVDLLESLGCPAYKIASMEITDIPLIKYAVATGKPLIISTGMASSSEMLYAAMSAGTNFALLHCISGYPSSIEEANLWKVNGLLGLFEPPRSVGISDHSPGWEIPVAATAMGACLIEKHIKTGAEGLQWKDSPVSEDEAFSLTPGEFREMCKAVRSVWKAMQPSEAKSEESSRQLRRSLYVTANMKTGEVFTDSNVRSIRPAYGLPPKELRNILGKTASQDIERGTALAWELIQS